MRDVRDATPVSANMRVVKATHTHTQDWGGEAARTVEVAPVAPRTWQTCSLARRKRIALVACFCTQTCFS